RPSTERCSTRPRSRTGREQCPHPATCSAHRSKSGRPARSTISSTVWDERTVGLIARISVVLSPTFVVVLYRGAQDTTKCSFRCSFPTACAPVPLIRGHGRCDPHTHQTAKRQR